MKLEVPQNNIGVEGKITYFWAKRPFKTYIDDIKAGGGHVDLDNVINKGWTFSVLLDYNAGKAAVNTASY